MSLNIPWRTAHIAGATARLRAYLVATTSSRASSSVRAFCVHATTIAYTRALQSGQ